MRAEHTSDVESYDSPESIRWIQVDGSCSTKNAARTSGGAASYCCTKKCAIGRVSEQTLEDEESLTFPV